MKFKFFFTSNIVIACLSFLALIATYINPHHFPYLGFFTWTLPLWLLLHLLYVGYWIWQGKKIIVWISLLSLVFCWQPIRASFQVSIPIEDAKGLKVLSYNARVFNVYNHLGKKDQWKSTQKMTEWIVNKEFDIMCFQEFYYEPDHKIFNTIYNLKTKRKYYHYFYKTYTNRIDGQFGLAIFSKYKIINHGLINYDKKSNNQIIFIDIIKGKDTLRVYNAHLVSNSIEDQEIPDAEFSQKSQQKATSLGRTLKRSFGKRGKQVDSLSKHMEACKHKAILCGDFNDLPYSYTYRTLSSHMESTFEAKGNGFGFTFNGKIPFLRIDHIFVSEGIETRSFNTHKDVKYSDHCPISAVLALE